MKVGVHMKAHGDSEIDMFLLLINRLHFMCDEFHYYPAIFKVAKEQRADRRNPFLSFSLHDWKFSTTISLHIHVEGHIQRCPKFASIVRALSILPVCGSTLILQHMQHACIWNASWKAPPSIRQIWRCGRLKSVGLWSHQTHLFPRMHLSYYWTPETDECAFNFRVYCMVRRWLIQGFFVVYTHEGYYSRGASTRQCAPVDFPPVSIRVGGRKIFLCCKLIWLTFIAVIQRWGMPEIRNRSSSYRLVLPLKRLLKLVTKQSVV